MAVPSLTSSADPFYPVPRHFDDDYAPFDEWVTVLITIEPDLIATV